MGKWGGKKAILEMMNRVVSVHNGGAVHLILGIIAIFMAHKRGGGCIVWLWGGTQGLWTGWVMASAWREVVLN